jgi:Right handed beta helix region
MERMMMTPTHALAAALAVATIALAVYPAGAVDGEILIDQAAVNAGGITPGDGAGFPAFINRSGRYKLSGNLRVPADQDGIQVFANDVTIDLNGFTISSDRLGEARGGVYVTDGDRVRIINGTITGFGGFGVHLYGGEFAVVENIRFVSAGGPFWGAIYSGRQARIRNNTITNSSAGIVDCLGCLIERNIITGSAFYGVEISGGVVVGNLIVGNTLDGLSGVGSNFPKSGYGSNIFVGNNGGNAQVLGNVFQLHPNFCDPACP